MRTKRFKSRKVKKRRTYKKRGGRWNSQKTIPSSKECPQIEVKYTSGSGWRNRTSVECEEYMRTSHRCPVVEIYKQYEDKSEYREMYEDECDLHLRAEANKQAEAKKQEEARKVRDNLQGNKPNLSTSS